MLQFKQGETIRPGVLQYGLWDGQNLIAQGKLVLCGSDVRIEQVQCGGGSEGELFLRSLLRAAGQRTAKRVLTADPRFVKYGLNPMQNGEYGIYPDNIIFSCACGQKNNATE